MIHVEHFPIQVNSKYTSIYIYIYIGYYHTGYTGTCVCNDPERELITIILSTRLFPDDTHESGTKFYKLRVKFNTAVQGLYDEYIGKIEFQTSLWIALGVTLGLFLILFIVAIFI